MDHQAASLLLPWLGTDRLVAAELEEVLDHLKVCPLCRGELRDLSDLGRFAELAERAEAPSQEAVEQRLAAVMARLAPAAPAASRPGRRVAWRQALPLAALVVLGLGLGYLGGRRQPVAAVGPYTTLSSPALAAPAGRLLRVVIEGDCKEGELRGLLLAAGAEIRGGPSRRGVYTLALPAGAAAEPQIATWRTESCFAFVDLAADGGIDP